MSRELFFLSFFVVLYNSASSLFYMDIYNILVFSIFFENITQILYHSVIIFSIFSIFIKKNLFFLAFVSNIIGLLFHKYELIDVILFEFLLFNDLFPATNPLSLKLFIQFFIFSILMGLYFSKKRNILITFNLVLLASILLTQTLYHKVFAINLASNFQQKLQLEVEEKIMGDYFFEYCNLTGSNCYEYKIEEYFSKSTNEEIKYGFSLNFVEKMEVNSSIIGYDPIFFNNALYKKYNTGEFYLIDDGNSIYHELSIFFEEYDSLVAIYKSDENIKIMFNVNHYTNGFRKYLLFFYFYSSLMMFIWYFMGLFLLNKHYNIFLKKERKKEC